MAREKTPTFIHELRLKTPPDKSKILSVRLNMARQIYNSVLGKGLKRLKLLKESKAYQRALKMPKHIKNKKEKPIINKARTDEFKSAKNIVRFSEYSLHKYLTHTYAKSWQNGNNFTAYLDRHVADKIATRAYNAIEQYSYGKKGRPRFKTQNRFSSVEGKSNDSGLRFVDDKITWSTNKGKSKLELKPIYDFKDKYGLETHALSCRTKYVRLVMRMIKGYPVWYAQLIKEGRPLIKSRNNAKKGIVGLDIGPSTIAIVSKNQAKLQEFCSEVKDYRKKIGTTQRKMSRSQRMMNLNNYKKDSIKFNSNGRKIKVLGTSKKGCNKWIFSKKYQIMRLQNLELYRKMAETRKSAHGNLANKILNIFGKTIKTEKLSYKSWQKNFGKSIGFRAPGLFVEILRRKAERAGGEVIEFKTKTTALSQMCHCGNKQKKTLKERWHKCKICGVTAQRDLYSAFLARFVENDKLDISQAKKAWASAGILLKQAMSNLNKTTIGKDRLASFGLDQSQSGCLLKKKST